MLVASKLIVYIKPCKIHKRVIDLFLKDCCITQISFHHLQVVSLVNLTLEEMRKALVEFCRLLVEDTYAVFYFAGHGFERGGLSYLMPVDASHSYRCQENMASAKVLKAMQETKAKLKLVLLDCCRTE